jgi:hypothetical protein
MAYPFVNEGGYQRLFWRYQQKYQRSPARQAHNLKVTDNEWSLPSEPVMTDCMRITQWFFLRSLEPVSQKREYFA